MSEQTFYIRTYGCQMNDADSERIVGSLIDRGYSMVDSPEQAAFVLLNTCAIREGAENKVYSDLGRLSIVKRERDLPMTIAVGGCVAQQEGERLLARNRDVNLVFGSRSIVKLPELMARVEAGERVVSQEIHVRSDLPDAQQRKDPYRAWITIMEGCDNHCAFCVVPATRGREVSRSPEGILAEAHALAQQGYVEITLLGQNVTSYRSGGADFTDLITRLCAVDGIRRIRYTTSHPKDFSERLIERLGSLPKVARHLHLPLQSGSDRVLAAMGRGYTFAEYLARIEKVRRRVPGIAVTTDMIVGFPGETTGDFEQTLDAVRRIGFLNLYGFKYSRRPGTPALKLGDHLSDDEKNARLAELLAAQREITLAHHNAVVGTVQEVLVEGISKRDTERLSGRLECGVLAHFEGDARWVGTLRPVRITQATASALAGTAA